MTHAPVEEPRYDRRELVEPPELDVRMRASWQHVAKRIGEPQPKSRSLARPMFAWGTAAALAAACAVLWLPRDVVRKPTEQPATTLAVALPDAPVPDDREDVQLSIEPDTEVAMLSESSRETRYRVHKGRATFEAPARGDKTLLVEVGELELRIASSRVTVLSDGREHPYIEVFVESGSVMIDGGEDARLFTRGQRFVQKSPIASKHSRRPRREHERAVRADVRAAQATHAEAPTEPSADARTLLDAASRARRSGQFGEAARAYERLLRELPDDARAPLAAFELGRLRMDHLSDLRGAVAPLRRAVAEGGSSASQEDALARLVRVFDRLGDQAACRKERESYLQRFSHGIHTAEVSQRCGVAP